MEDHLPKVLIVDDRPENLVALEHILDEFELKLYKATSGKDALSLVLKQEFALILLDVQMPEMDGFEAADLIRSREKSKSIPIIFVTAINKEKSHVYKGYDKGAVDYLFKPLDEYVLIAKVNVFLELYNNRKIQENLLSQLKEAHTELEIQNEKLSFLAMHDTLTMLNNRLAFDGEGKRLFAESIRKNRNFGLLLIDLDEFKWINDKHGHLIGDKVLKRVGNILDNTILTGDFVARIGGDEFAVIVNDIKRIEDSGIVAEKILNNFKNPLKLPGIEDIHVDVSIGISCFSSKNKSFSDIFKEADVALYKAKFTGKKHFEFYSKIIRNLYLNKKDMIYELRKALENKEFILNYQPIVDIRTKQIVGLETLLRWKNDNLGKVSPAKFIPIAEEIGIIHDIGLWVLDNACQQFVEWEKNKIENLFYTINVSPLQFKKESFIDNFNKLFSKYNLDPTKIELELTESSLSPEYNNNLENCMLYLNNSKMNISIDDFGTGYSSLSRLGNLPINTLKIDASFFSDFNFNHKNISIIKSIISLANNLSMKTIAEGIEKKEHVDFLLENKSYLAQGFYFHKPMHTDELTKILLKENKT
jgi:diguanylate cyclase (GGDEF)-like protein